ncbi:P-loop containing nucleoside triphosphate hydrolase protein [Thozetella sp. PMI_491]|nr:P-loop containing nucleoside triphosphate hydrolase protein [Thozetella sp. PMI_491]
MRAVLAIRHAISTVGTSMTPFATMPAFITYTLSSQELTSSHVFSSLSLFGVLSMPLNQLPLILGHVTDAAQSILRIQEFLLVEEAQDPESLRAIRHRIKGPIRCEGGKEQVFTLRDLNLTVGRHEPVAVIGTVGSGKSSLLSALVGDMGKTRGIIKFGASRAFCPQSAWIQNTSIKDNIILGRINGTASSESDQVSDRRWYNDPLDACALRPDLDIFPYGGLTELGERGITILGGQKKQLNIARAIYSDADLILMDDLLSAVDAHVGRHSMDNAICDLLKDKCCILATHQLHVLRRCDRIVYMSGGRIFAHGTFDHIKASDTSFQRGGCAHAGRRASSASHTMLQAAVTRVLRATMSFFDTTPLARITNRFSRDVDVMDNNLPDTLRNFLIFSEQDVAVFILVLAYFPHFAVALFTASVNKAVDDMDGAYFLTFANQRWLSVRLDAIGNLLVLTTGILIVTSRLSVNPSISGLVLSCIISVAQYF